MNDNPYARLYHKFQREFPTVYADDHALSTWVRLLMLADASWPTRPPLPRSVSRRMVRCLSEAGLLIVQGDTYTLLGLDAERTRRSNAARTGAAKRWDSDRTSDRNANASAVAMPRRDETSRDEISPPPPSGAKRQNGTNPRALGTNPRALGTSPRQERERIKRDPTPIHEILRRAAAAGSDA